MVGADSAMILHRPSWNLCSVAHARNVRRAIGASVYGLLWLGEAFCWWGFIGPDTSRNFLWYVPRLWWWWVCHKDHFGPSMPKARETLKDRLWLLGVASEVALVVDSTWKFRGIFKLSAHAEGPLPGFSSRDWSILQAPRVLSQFYSWEWLWCWWDACLLFIQEIRWRHRHWEYQEDGERTTGWQPTPRNWVCLIDAPDGKYEITCGQQTSNNNGSCMWHVMFPAACYNDDLTTTHIILKIPTMMMMMMMMTNWRVPNPPSANPLVTERAFPTTDYWGRTGVARCAAEMTGTPRDFQ